MNKKYIIISIVTLLVIVSLIMTLNIVTTPTDGSETPKSAIVKAEKKERIDTVKNEFLEYVNLNFDNPNDLIEIVEIKQTDTISNHFFDDIMTTISSFKNHFGAGYKIKRLKKLHLIYQLKDFRWQLYEIRIRLNVEGKKKMVLYQAIDDGDTIKFQDHLLRLSESPYLFAEIAELSEDILYSLTY